MTTAAPPPPPAAEALNSLLRGEIAAAETYTQAIDKVEPSDGIGVADTLRRLREDHVDAANALRRFVVVRGAENETSSGAWGAFAKAVEGTATLLGNEAALKALKEGESRGVKSYERALEKDALDPAARQMIRSTLLPRQTAHLATLERLLGAA